MKRSRLVRSAVALGIMAAALTLSSSAQDAAAARQRRAGSEPGEAANANESAPTTVPVPAEAKAETKHDWTAGGRTVHYTATAGNLVIRDDNDHPNGSIFYVAYTEDGAPARNRPVTFLYNGGPWLRLALAAHGFGRSHPRRHVQP